VTADERRPPPWGPLPELETPFLDYEPPAGQRAEPSQARLGELEAETAFAGAFDLSWAQPGPGERERAEELGEELVSPGAFELEEPGIIDGDNRLRVKDTTGVPWRWICKIDIADSRGRPAGAGTGLLISNRHVLTAAHVVHDAYKNMQQYTITVIPALDDLEEPFGRYALASKPNIRQEYDPTAADSLDWDYALLTLGSAVGNQRFKTLNYSPLCFWGSPQCGESTMLARLDPGALNGKAAHTAGYPGGKAGRQLWCAAGILHSANQQRRIMYTTADTTRGQSGSPVWVIDNKRHCLVGIAAAAGTGSNRIVRVTRELVHQLRAWITEGGETPAMVETEEALEPPILLLPQPEAPPDEQPVEQQFDSTAIPHDVAAALGKRDWPLALSLAIRAGWHDENELTNLIFFARHPELPMEPLKRDDPNTAKWKRILDEEVWKAIEVSAENTDLVVSGEEVTVHHRTFFGGQTGRRLRKLVKDAASEVGVNPGLLGTIMMAETRRPRSYLSSEKVSSYHIGCDDFYEYRAARRARVPAYAKVKWDRSQTPVEHLNDADTPRMVKTIWFDSGPDGVLATAVELKFREVRLREIAAGLHGDFDSLPPPTRFALARMAFAGGTGGATRYLKDALDGVDIFVREAIPLRKGQTQRNATVRTAQAMHLSDWVFKIPVERATRPAGHELETWGETQGLMQLDVPGSSTRVVAEDQQIGLDVHELPAALEEPIGFVSAFDEPDEAEGAHQASADDVQEEGEAVTDEAELQMPQAGGREAPRREAKPEIILVAGANYPKFEDAAPSRRERSLSAGPWREYCLRVAEERLKANPALNVTLFDFLLGTRESVTLDAKRQAVTTVEQQFTAPIADDYRNLLGIDLTNPTPAQAINATLAPANKRSLSKRGQISYFETATALAGEKTIKLMDYLAAASKIAPQVISITDVYTYIEGFARSGKTGALHELHFIAHAFNVRLNKYSGGPILLNSMDNPLQPNRYPFDKDARAEKDFTKPTMDPTAFAQAFGAGAQSFVWGCNFQRGFIRQFVHQISKHRRILAAGKSMEISYTADWGTKGEFRTRLGLGSADPVKNVSVGLGKIDKVLRDTSDATYMKKLATASGCPVVGAPPGTYADYDSVSSPLELMHIPMTNDPFRNAHDSFENALLYFRDHLKFRFDTSFGDHNGLGRGYIVYDP